MNDQGGKRVFEAEVVGYVLHGGKRSGWSSFQSGPQGPRLTYFSMMGPGAPGHQGMSLASAITLGIFAACLVQWGFLAGLGFLFFHFLASAAGVYHNFRMVLEGRVPNPWLWRAGSWAFSLLLVSWLVP